MGFGLLLLIIVFAGALYFGKKLGWANALSTLGYSAQSSFMRSETSGKDATFTVTPARSSRGAVLFIALGVLIFLIPGIGILGLVPLIMGLLILPVGSRYRKPATLNITDTFLNNGNQKWPLADIAALNIREGSSFNTDDPGQAVYTTPQGDLMYGGKSTSVLFTKALARRVVDRSYLLTLRTRQDSNETVLSGGLTESCAQALKADLKAELAKRAIVLGE